MNTSQPFHLQGKMLSPESVGKKIHAQWVKHLDAERQRRAKQDRQVR
jgi:hypothetical protein